MGKERYHGPPGWGLGMRLISVPHRNLFYVHQQWVCRGLKTGGSAIGDVKFPQKCFQRV